MAVSLPNGATVSVGTTYATAKNMTAVSNANPAVATLEASHGIIVGDVFRVVSGWSKLSGRVPRASVVATNDVTMEGIDTTSTTTYPAGSGVGTVQEVTGWTQITQVLEAATSGGEQQFTTYSFLEDSTERQIPTAKSAQSFTLTIADDSTLPHYAALLAADTDKLPRVIRLALPSGSKLYYQAFVTINPTPTITKNEVMGLQVTFSLIADPVRYST